MLVGYRFKYRNNCWIYCNLVGWYLCRLWTNPNRFYDSLTFPLYHIDILALSETSWQFLTDRNFSRGTHVSYNLIRQWFPPSFIWWQHRPEKNWSQEAKQRQRKWNCFWGVQVWSVGLRLCNLHIPLCFHLFRRLIVLQVWLQPQTRREKRPANFSHLYLLHMNN